MTPRPIEEELGSPPPGPSSRPSARRKGTAPRGGGKGGDQPDPAGSCQSSPGTCGVDSQSLSIEKARWQLAYCWIRISCCPRCPVRSLSTPIKPKVTFSQADTEEMLVDLPENTPDFARAMLAQSQALTALVAQIANNSGDPFHDMGQSGTSLSSKGPMGREKNFRRCPQWQGLAETYGMPPAKPMKEQDVISVTVGFKGLFQGDYLGVEFAL